ncbi:MAG TPA: glycosyltransferase family 4 protein [Candidatus Deferrimicrobiaceae bacterium]
MISPAASRWLVLSYFANIDGMAPSQHIDDRLPHLRRLGIAPILLTGPCCDPIEGMIHARVASVAPSGLRFELRHFRRRSAGAIRMLGTLASAALLPAYLLEKLAADLDSQWSWFPRAARKGRALCRENAPNLIYSTGGPWSAHVAAARIARTTGLPWIAELQDPLVHGDWLRSRVALRVAASVERMIFRDASAVVYLTQAARDAAESRTGVSGKAVCIYAGAEPFPDPPPLVAKKASCRFAHFGSLGGSRNLKVFLDALAMLFRDHPDLADKAGLDVYGTVDRLSRALIEAFPWANAVTIHGRVPRRESLAAMRRADVLLLIQNTEEFSIETIPSKTYEYLHAGRPVLGLVYRNPELYAMLEGAGHVAADGADPAAVKEAALRLILSRESAGESAPKPSPYTVAAAVDALASLGASLGKRA